MARLCFVAQMDKLRTVNEMQHHHLPCAARDHAAEHVVSPSPHAQLPRELGLALNQPAGLEGRRKLGHTHVARAGKMPADLGKGVVRPYNLPGCRQCDNRRQRRGSHRGMYLSTFNPDVFHQFLHISSARIFAVQRYHPQYHAKCDADHTVRYGKIQSAQCKQQEQHIKQAVSWCQRFLQTVFQIPVPLYGRKDTG